MRRKIRIRRCHLAADSACGGSCPSSSRRRPVGGHPAVHLAAVLRRSKRLSNEIIEEKNYLVEMNDLAFFFYSLVYIEIVNFVSLNW